MGDAVNMYGDRNSTDKETYGITIKNVKSRAEHSLHLAGNIADLQIENVTTFDNGGDIEDKRI